MGEKQLSVLEQVKARAAALRQADAEREDAARRERDRVARQARACKGAAHGLAQLLREAGLADLPLPDGKILVRDDYAKELWGVGHPSGDYGHLVGASHLNGGPGRQLVFAVECDHDGAAAWLTHDGERIDADTALLMVADLAERLARGEE